MKQLRKDTTTPLILRSAISGALTKFYCTNNNQQAPQGAEGIMKTDSQRKAEQRERERANGIKYCTVKVHKEDREKIKELAAKLLAARQIC